MYYDRINVSEGIDLAKSNKSKGCMICHYWFFNHGFRFQDYVCNGRHDLTMLCLDMSDITIITVKNIDYFCIIHNISKSEAITLLESVGLEKRGYIKKYCFNFQSIQDTSFFFSLFRVYYIYNG